MTGETNKKRYQTPKQMQKMNQTEESLSQIVKNIRDTYNTSDIIYKQICLSIITHHLLQIVSQLKVSDNLKETIQQLYNNISDDTDISNSDSDSDDGYSADTESLYNEEL